MGKFVLVCRIVKMTSLLGFIFLILIVESYQYHSPYHYEYNINNGRGGSQYVSFIRGRGLGRSFYLSNNKKALTLPKFNKNIYSFIYSRTLNKKLNRGLTDGDFIAQIREQINADPRAADILNKIIEDDDNICFSSLDDGIKSIEIATSLLENAEGDIKTLLAKINFPNIVRSS